MNSYGVQTTGRVCWSLLLGIMGVAAIAGEVHGGPGRKVRISDEQAARQVEAGGGRLVAAYGSYRVFEVDSAAAEALKAREGIEIRDDYDRVFLNAGGIDTTTAPRTSAAQFGGKRLHLVQFAGPIQPAWHDALRDCGVEIVSYIPSNAYLVYGNAASLARLKKLAEIQWDGVYRDEYKIQPAKSSGLYAIQLVRDADTNPDTLRLIGNVRQQFTALNYLNVVAPLDSVAQIAARPDVISIQPYEAPSKMCERQDQIVAGNISADSPSGPGYLAFLTSNGFTQAQFSNSAFAVDISDSGIDNGTTSPNHFGLFTLGKTNQPSRVVYNRLVGTPNTNSTIKGCDGHGNINAHIIAGYDDTTIFPHVDSAGFHYGLGVCPFIKVGSSVIFDPGTFTFPNYANLQSMAYHDGARISNNSWGTPTNWIYSVVSQTYDALVRDAQPAGSTFATSGNQEMTIVFAAGDDGSFGATTILAPATAKNVICVGASDSVQRFGAGTDGCLVADTDANSAADIASFSSRGPCADGRMKPDLVAPGTHVSGGVIQVAKPGNNGTADACFGIFGPYVLRVCGGNISSNDWPFFPSGQQFYTASSGTSIAAPAVAGAAALLRQNFINRGLSPPSPAMTKAYLMNCGRYLAGNDAGDTLWSPNQGMGAVSLATAFDATSRILRDELAVDKFTATGQTRTFTGTISDSTKPCRVTVAWTDAPGSTTGDAFNNDLDLTVTIGGQTYKGNVFSSGFSTPGGVADFRNNVESVFIPPGVTGSFVVTITAANINSDGVPGDVDLLDQDFALVIYNARGGISPYSAALTSESCIPTNSAIDPGETVTLQLGLRNIGTVNTTNLVATLLATNGVTSPSSPQTYGVLTAGGIAVTRPFTFTANGTCATNISATLQLQDGASNLGTVAFIFALGAAATNSQTFSDTGPVVAIPDDDPAGINIPIVVSGFIGQLTDLNFSIDGSSCTAAAGATSNGINHTLVGDLILKLTSPSGTTITLMRRPGPGALGSDGNNFCNTLLKDGASSSIQNISSSGAPYTGTFAPYEALGTFRDEDPNGTWILNISDNEAGETGDVRAFSLRLFGHACCGSVADSDGDGLPDGWEMQYFGNLNQIASGDPDADGKSNLQEFQSGTNPNNSASALRSTAIVRTNNDIRITWSTAGGRTNVVQAVNAPTGNYSTNFITISPNIIITGAGDTTTNYLDVGGAINAPARFYRIRLVP